MHNKKSFKAKVAFFFSSFKTMFEFPPIDGIDMTWEELNYDLIFKKDPAIREYYKQKLAKEA